MDLIQPKEIQLTDETSATRTYILSKFPAVSGREIVTQYPLTGLPKIGEYALNEALMLKLMNFVAVPLNGTPTRLSTRALVENHVPSWELLAKIEMEMMAYNCSFFLNGRASTFLSALAEKVPELISQILTVSLERLSQADKPASTNSEQSTASKTPT